MTDTTANPLTDEEREELEALRAEKARREEEERTRREREELEALRAEQERIDAEILAERALAECAEQRHEAARQPAGASSAEGQAAAGRSEKVPSSAASARVVSFATPPSAPSQGDPQGGSASKSFGERMVTSDAVDGDGIPTMPMAQKIILVIACIALVAFAIYTVTR
ncbi:hypothetical protein [Collinsella stercoris]|uniref:Uncharacterized protein n=1 Tax=Collinsella stercoris DSM 13279 TaxID=445975 RepID=B6GBJ2_9ACTN|nr:hypothetical protein [Collinsella stercoris]EEA90345.1 hypothetical protein COLSTE_01452 [Collinsella stercoris DSM 13279]UEA46253.1 hypothetical protein LK434_03925 [Collinsella stercoris DSM 13279]UWP11230.1 hypothetical protein NQ498_08085 [Collinsella stercoris]